MASRGYGRRPRFESEKPKDRYHYPPEESSQTMPTAKPMLLQRRPANSEPKQLFPSEESFGAASAARRSSLSKEKETEKREKEEEPGVLEKVTVNVAKPPAPHQLYVSDVENNNPEAEKKDLPVKLLDESLVFVNSLAHFLREQTDFLVVGCIGTQGVGKSRILSSVFHHQPEKGFIFPTETQDDIETGSHRTSGIDVYVTSDRTILLDCQPVLSSSVMYKDLQADWEKKIGLEFGSMDAAAEMNSVQLISFLLCVCHVVLVTQDWIIDTNILRLIQTAEMLKPSFPPPNQDEPYVEAFPHVAFVFNRASPDDARPEKRSKISETLKRIFAKSNLKIESGISNVVDEQQFSMNLSFIGEDYGDVAENRRYIDAATRLRLSILSTPRHLVSYANLSEKSWLTYAAKVWDFIKKSPLYMEYSRLLP